MAYDNNPCSCSGIITGSSSSSGCTGDNCIIIPNMLLAGSNSVEPCGYTKSVVFDENCLDLCHCEDGTTTYEIDSYSSNLTNVSIDENGITFTTNGSSSDEYIAEITYIVRCTSTKDSYKLSSRGSLTIVFKDMCEGVRCSTGYSCAKCTGACVADGADLDVT